MLEILKNVSVLFGLAVVGIGIVGGLPALPEKIKQFRKSWRPLGDRGTAFSS